MSIDKGKDLAEGSLRSPRDQPVTPSRYESQKRRDWNTFGHYLKNQRPPVSLSSCSSNHVLDFLRYLDQFGKTKVHLQGCTFYGQAEPPAPCTCPGSEGESSKGKRDPLQEEEEEGKSKRSRRGFGFYDEGLLIVWPLENRCPLYLTGLLLVCIKFCRTLHSFHFVTFPRFCSKKIPGVMLCH
ncbi:hypothetical protein U1Q18_001711 [Sarracenia purpurea var. burkii]